MSAAPEEILSYGLIDRVSLARVHTDVLENDPDAPLSHVQKQVLSLVRSLVGDELFEVGDLSGKGGYFVKWDTSLNESMQRIFDMYVTRFDDKGGWPWDCWLNLTEKGLPAARAAAGLTTP